MLRKLKEGNITLNPQKKYGIRGMFVKKVVLELRDG